ncbi:pathogen-related protein-like [Syzygium oleosum]|uniref:pathogen-related protein-like n=1 Tax=Syzygium oleosum TaxID=219896 RepID=UPI0024B95242|nr:pathogen-related protein-like [Syzygium oleosum]
MGSTLFSTQSGARHGNAASLISLLALPCMHRICYAATSDIKKTSPSEIITRRTFGMNGVWTDSAIAHRLGFFFLCLATHCIVLINRRCRESIALITLRLLLLKVEPLSKVEDVKVAADKYRSMLNEETENTQWRHGGPPIFYAVNKLFEEGRTKEWPQGSIEEAVQNAVKSWEMELSHKTRLQDFKTIKSNPSIFDIIFQLFGFRNKTGREGLSGEETLRLGSYNALMQNSLPEEFRYYKADQESFQSSHDAFRLALPRGFAREVVSVYSGPPVITYKFRRWGYFEGPFKEHAATGEMVEFYGVGIMKVDESMRAEEVEKYYDPAELFGGLLKGKPIS